LSFQSFNLEALEDKKLKKFVAEVFLQWLYEQVFMTVVARIN
jgi:hypothetical protein